jgi:hypothetical protein
MEVTDSPSTTDVDRREENRDEQDDLDNDRPKKTDEEDHGVHTAGIKRKSDRS